MGEPKDFDQSQALVHSDPALRTLATSFVACGPYHYAGAGTGDPAVLEWAAWDAYHALKAARLASVDDREAAVVAALEHTLFICVDDRPSCLAGHVAAVLEAVDA